LQSVGRIYKRLIIASWWRVTPERSECVYWSVLECWLFEEFDDRHRGIRGGAELAGLLVRFGGVGTGEGESAGVSRADGV